MVTQIKRVRLGKEDRCLVDDFIGKVGYVDTAATDRIIQLLRRNPDNWWRIAQSTDQRILRELIQIPDLPWDVREYLLLHRNKAVADCALAYGTFSDQELDSFLTDTSGWSWYALATRKDLPASWLEQLLQNPQLSVRMALAHNPDLPKSTVHRLVGDTAGAVRARVAERSDLEEADLLNLGHDDEAGVRIVAVQNPHWKGEITEDDLAGRSNREVILLAEKGNLSDAILTNLAKQDDVPLARALVRRKDNNLILPREACLALVASGDVSIRQIAAERLILTDELVDILVADPNGKVREALALRPDLDPRGRGLLSGDRRGEVRASIAGKGDLDEVTALLFARDRSLQVRMALAMNSNLTSEAAQKVLMEDEDSRVPIRLGEHGHALTHPLLHRYASQISYPAVRLFGWPDLNFTFQRSVDIDDFDLQRFIRTAREGPRLVACEVRDWRQDEVPLTLLKGVAVVHTQGLEGETLLQALECADLMSFGIYEREEGRKICAVAQVETAVPFGMRNGGQWELLDARAEKGLLATLPVHFDGVGRLVRIEDRSLFMCPFSEVDSRIHWWAVPVLNARRAVSRQMGTLQVGCDREREWPEGFAGQGVPAALSAEILADGGIYALWEDPVGKLGWTFEESSEIPEERTLREQELINPRRQRRLEGLFDAIRKIGAKGLTL